MKRLLAAAAACACLLAAGTAGAETIVFDAGLVPGRDPARPSLTLDAPPPELAPWSGSYRDEAGFGPAPYELPDAWVGPLDDCAGGGECAGGAWRLSAHDGVLAVPLAQVSEPALWLMALAGVFVVGASKRADMEIRA